MAYEQKPNSFSLFANDRKSKDTDADYTGTLKIEGAEYWINGWKKDSGKLVMSGTVKAKTYAGTPAAKPAPAQSQSNEFDEVPF